MRLIWTPFLMLWPVFLAGQYSSLATDRHGTKVLFSTTLTLRGEERNDVSKILEATASGELKTRLSVKPEYTTTSPLEALNFPSLVQPDMSSDGEWVAWSGFNLCDPRKNCGTGEHVRATIQNDGKPTVLDGNVRLSSNGRWGLVFNPQAVSRGYDALRLDLQSGTRHPLPRWLPGTPLWGLAPSGRRVISNDGTFVSATRSDDETQPPTLFVYRPGIEVKPIRLERALEGLTLSDDARFAVGETVEDAPELVAVELSSGEVIPLVYADEGCRAPALSEDGTVLFFLSAANWLERNPRHEVQAWTIDLVTGELEQWTDEQSGVIEGTVSGDGQVVWASTLDGRLIRVVRSQSAAEIVERTSLAEPIPGRPQIGVPNPPPILFPGVEYALRGVGLLEANLRWNGSDVEIIESTPGRLRFELPLAPPAGLGLAELEQPQSRFQPQQFMWDVRLPE